MSDEWDEHAASWDEGAPVAYADGAAASLRRHAEALGLPLRGARVLDFGCGTGLLAERLAPEVGSIVGLDPSPGMIARLSEKIAAGLANVTAVQGVLDDTTRGLAPFEAPFDLVVASSVCAFLPDYPATMIRIVELLRPGGAIVQWDWELRAEDAEPFGLTRDDMREALAGAGLEVRFVDTGFSKAFGEMTMAPLMGVGVRPSTPT